VCFGRENVYRVCVGIHLSFLLNSHDVWELSAHALLAMVTNLLAMRSLRMSSCLTTLSMISLLPSSRTTTGHYHDVLAVERVGRSSTYIAFVVIPDSPYNYCDASTLPHLTAAQVGVAHCHAAPESSRRPFLGNLPQTLRSSVILVHSPNLSITATSICSYKQFVKRWFGLRCVRFCRECDLETPLWSSQQCLVVQVSNLIST
jgi:hypothetical protein